MATLDNESLIQTLDSENMLGVLNDLPDQIDAAWFHSKAVALPTHYIQSTNVIIIGIGSSAVAGLVASTLSQSDSRKPIQVLEGGSLPEYVDSHTLVIGVSYSGKTPETVDAFAEAGKRGAKLFGVTTGGDIAALCRKYRAPLFTIQYGAQPRAAIGYLTVPIIAVLERLNFLSIGKVDETMRALSTVIQQQCERIGTRVPTSQNLAKQLATGISGTLPLLVGSPLTRPALRRWQMQLQQMAKTMTLVDELPSGLYTTLEGISFPSELTSSMFVLQLRLGNDNQFVATAHNAYTAFAKKRRLKVEDVLAPGSLTLIEELFALMVLGDFVSYYLALLAGVDPSSTPNMMELLQLRGDDSVME